VRDRGATRERFPCHWPDVAGAAMKVEFGSWSRWLRGAPSASVEPRAISGHDLIWALGSFCALRNKPFDPNLVSQQFPPPLGVDTLVRAARALDFKTEHRACSVEQLRDLPVPCLVVLDVAAEPGAEVTDVGSTAPYARLAMLVQVHPDRVVLFHAGTNTPTTYPTDDFRALYLNEAVLLAPKPTAPTDKDAVGDTAPKFGFRWFIPELLKHRSVWGQVLVASLVIQLLALATPLFTQLVIDKVVVHHTESTLIVIGVGLAVFMVFSAVLSWIRQYLVLHTGNRVDAVLGAAVFEHVLKLPPRYFEQRQTGVIVARLRGVENIREFIASTAVTVVLDLPFLLIFIAMMFAYSVALSLLTLGLISVIVVMSFLVAPVFRARMNEQFLLGARTQAFTTEYIAGMETVKSLQLEPQLRDRYGEYLAEYLRSGFEVRQIANTYNVLANSIEQLLTLLILIGGAYLVMHGDSFTIGMLVAFQMFASRVSQPMLRLVGLWQQFQQAQLSVDRLGDVMNAPTEPYSVVPRGLGEQQGAVVIEDLSFRYGPGLPLLYENFNLTIEPGQVVALMGPSGSGKSTLAKVLQGFYQPESGRIRIGGIDIRNLAANELRQNFGVVPQETTLFATTVYENLLMASPGATFDQIVETCRMAEIHEAISQLPDGYQTEIGERGVGLSTGQKQRIAIARALLKRPKILIFDEATSSLDTATAEQLALTVNRLRGKISMLFVTHGLPSSLLVDKVVDISSHAHWS
jgi:ATP-binding cassette, subfamily B, bacterial HlyB/CyaB